jgi:hypothetical protein
VALCFEQVTLSCEFAAQEAVHPQGFLSPMLSRTASSAAWRICTQGSFARFRLLSIAGCGRNVLAFFAMFVPVETSPPVPEDVNRVKPSRKWRLESAQDELGQIGGLLPLAAPEARRHPFTPLPSCPQLAVSQEASYIVFARIIQQFGFLSGMMLAHELKFR